MYEGLLAAQYPASSADGKIPFRYLPTGSGFFPTLFQREETCFVTQTFHFKIHKLFQTFLSSSPPPPFSPPPPHPPPHLSLSLSLKIQGPKFDRMFALSHLAFNARDTCTPFTSKLGFQSTAISRLSFYQPMDEAISLLIFKVMEKLAFRLIDSTQIAQTF